MRHSIPRIFFQREYDFAKVAEYGFSGCHIRVFQNILLQANVEGWHLYLEKRVDAVSKQDAWHQVQHHLVSANDKYVDLSELSWRVRRVHVIGPSKSTQHARRLAAKKDSA